MTISIKPTASGSTIEQDGSTILTVDGSGNISTPNTFTSTGAITGTGGIYLGGTASANLLDDYEEGSWTPVLTDDTNTVNGIGRYVKIKNLVWVNIVFQNPTAPLVGSASEIGVTGFPFIIINDSNYQPYVPFTPYNMKTGNTQNSTAGSWGMFVDSMGTKARLRWFRDNQIPINLTGNDLNPSTSIRIQFSYLVGL